MTPAQELKKRKRDLILRYSRSSDLRGLTQLLTTMVPLAMLWVAAMWSFHVSYWLTAALTAAIFFFDSRVFVLMHDAGHGSLCESKRLNRWVGFLLGVVAGMPQYVWSQHHDFHHRTNGDWDRYRGTMTTLTLEEYAALSKTGQAWYRRKCSIYAAPFVGFVYLIFNPRFNWMRGSIALLVHLARGKSAASFKTRLWADWRQYRHQTANNLVLLTGWAVMCWLFGPAHFFLVYVISLSFAGGAGMVLFTVQHNFEHAYASATPDWNIDEGTLEGTSFLVFPKWMNWFTADIAYHHVHHISAAIPNYALVEAHRENEDLFTGVTRIPLRGVPAALKCILWDKRARRIITVAEYERQLAGSSVGGPVAA